MMRFMGETLSEEEIQVKLEQISLTEPDFDNICDIRILQNVT